MRFKFVAEIEFGVNFAAEGCWGDFVIIQLVSADERHTKGDGIYPQPCEICGKSFTTNFCYHLLVKQALANVYVRA